MVFGVQKVGFCIAKVWFLFFKRVFFVLQYTIPHPRTPTKRHCDFPPLVLQCRYFYLLYPTFRHVHPVGVGADLSCPYPRTPPKWHCGFPPLILQYIIPHPRTPTKWRCVSYHFDISKPFGSDCKTGAMNRPLRLTECSLLYICVINEHCGMFVDIFCITHLLFIATFTHVLPRPPRRRRGRFIVPVPTNTHKMALRIPIVDIAIHHTAPTKFHKMVLRIPTVDIAIHHTAPT